MMKCRQVSQETNLYTIWACCSRSKRKVCQISSAYCHHDWNCVSTNRFPTSLFWSSRWPSPSAHAWRERQEKAAHSS